MTESMNAIACCRFSSAAEGSVNICTCGTPGAMPDHIHEDCLAMNSKKRLLDELEQVSEINRMLKHAKIHGVVQSLSTYASKF